MKDNYTVLMSVYWKDRPEWLRESLDSIFSQTLRPKEVVLVEDGALGDELESVIMFYKEKYDFTKVIKIEQNVGLGRALNEGLKYCSNDIVARMDSDDIAMPERMARQLEVFDRCSDIDVVSCWIDEFMGSKSNIVSTKSLPENHEAIEKYAKRRCPVNHPAVMFRKSAVMAAGGYKHFRLFEDYYLWARMLVNGSKFYNIQEPLLWFRVSPEMYKRRGGIRYAIDEIKFQQELYRIGFIGFGDKLYNIGVRSVVRLIPNGLRAFFYKKVLRR
jgi:Glycosyltransferases, probably involved in cell wall biogenesis